MAESMPMPDDLRRWVTGRLPGMKGAVDVSWPRGNSRVWRITAGQDTAFVKLSPTPGDWEREQRGYAYAAGFLREHEAPRLLAVDEGLRAVLTSHLPGRIVRGLELAADEERRIHELAGRLLGRWHGHSAPAGVQDRSALCAAAAGQAAEAAACLENTVGRLERAELALVQRVVRELPLLASDLPLVFQHGDYSTRNWMWNADAGTHGLIDFERAAPGAAVEEFVWMCGALWGTRPDLKESFLTGYGRPLTAAEELALPLFTARLGVSYLSTGLTKGSRELVDRGHFVLAHLSRNHT
ncbi:aminoglycoside phosphotransferase family protein [Streptomyces sp. NPDC056716]|uniref:aminoglycoside phosphotransferase family protein n=1 Tax=unclassified Streptomyces TaxID=2593676 RepID=UPI003699E37E